MIDHCPRPIIIALVKNWVTLVEIDFTLVGELFCPQTLAISPSWLSIIKDVMNTLAILQDTERKISRGQITVEDPSKRGKRVHSIISTLVRMAWCPKEIEFA